MHNLIKIDSIEGMARDVSSHAVVSTSSTSINDYLARRKAMQDRDSRFEEQQEQIDSLKNDLNDIKTMLKALLQR